MKRAIQDIRENIDHVGCDNGTALEMCAKIEADAKVILGLRTRLEDTVYPLGEIDGLMKVIAALRERMTQIRALVSTISESNWRDIGEHIARQAAEYEQTAGK